MADPWAVASEAPAQTFEDQWAPVEDIPQDPWKPVSVQPAPTLGDHPQGRGILQALKDYPMHLLEGLTSLPQRAIESSQQDVQHLGQSGYEPQSIGPAVEAAMLGGVKPSIAGVRLPLKLSPAEGAAEAPKPVEAPAAVPAEAPVATGDWTPVRETPFEAYHGSPYSFDQFDATKIGTGEGAQAYGHGFYVAENPEVGKSYQDSSGDATGNLYKTNVLANKNNFYDWDKPFSAQTSQIQETLRNFGITDEEGISKAVDDPTFVQKLSDAGIPGTKYFDAGSRAAANGTHNYVVFNPKHIEITHKNGELVSPQVRNQMLSQPAEASPAVATAGAQETPPVPAAPAEASPATPKPPQALADDLQAIRQSSVADRAEVGNTIRALPEEAKTPEIGEKLYHAAEDPAKLEQLTPDERAIYDQHLQPLRDEQAQLATQAKELGGADLVEDPNYMHRIAKGHAPAYDSLSGDAYDPITGTRGLPRTTSAMQERKYFVAESPTGIRKVVSATPDGVQVWNDKAPTNIPTGDELKPGEPINLNGKDWQVKQATTAEIEKNTPTEYHKNAFVNTADAVVRLREVVRNLKFVNDVKASPWWLDHATKAGGNAEIPKGWVRPKMPQFSDWYVDPAYAHVLDDFYKPGLFDAENGLRRINQWATSSMFWNPIPHMQNIGVHWAVGRGWDWIRPGPLRHFATDMTRAIKAVVTQDKDYQRFLKQGGGLVYGGVKNADFYGDMGRHMGMDIEKNWGRWKPTFDKLGLSKPYEAVAWWYGKMRNVLWATSDMFMVHRYLELERKGLSTAKAITEAEKHIPNYRIPPKIMGSRFASQVAQEPALTVFSRYHYGMWNSFMHMAVDLAKGTPKEKLEALGNVAALAFMGYVAYPVVDAIYQKLTGDDKAKMLRRGAMTVPHGVGKVLRNEQGFSDFLQSNITAAPATKEILQQFFGKDFFTGNELGGVVPRVEHAGKTVLSPLGTAESIAGPPDKSVNTKGKVKQLPASRTPGRTVLDTIVGGENTSPRTESGKAYGALKRNQAAASHERNPKGLLERGYYGAKHALVGEPVPAAKTEKAAKAKRSHHAKKVYGGPQ